jgi:hypothetical protein
MSSERLSNRIMIGWLAYCTTLSIYSYLADCILNFKYALDNIDFPLIYLMMSVLFHFYLILPAIYLYFFLFKDKKGLLLPKVLYAIIIGSCICLFLYPDDYSLYIGKFRKVKQLSSYVFAGVSLILADEYNLFDKLFKRKKLVQPR